MNDKELSFMGGTEPLKINACDGSHVTINVTVNSEVDYHKLFIALQRSGMVGSALLPVAIIK